MTKKKRNDYLDIKIKPVHYSDKEYLSLTPKEIVSGRKQIVSMKGEMSAARVALLLKAITRTFKIKDVWKKAK
jgi:hypothetical protein